MLQYTRPMLSAAAIVFVPLSASADALDAKAVAMFEAVYDSDQCFNYYAERPAPIRHSVEMDDDDGPTSATIFEFACDAGAYNVVRVVLIHTKRDGLRLATFATPVPDIHYAETADDEDNPYSSPVERIDITGYQGRARLTNPSIDESRRAEPDFTLW